VFIVIKKFPTVWVVVFVNNSDLRYIFDVVILDDIAYFAVIEDCRRIQFVLGFIDEWDGNIYVIF
jgi:hypothetical protein